MTDAGQYDCRDQPSCGSCRQAQRLRRAAQWHWELSSTADLQKPLAIALQFRMLSQRRADFGKDLRRMFIRRLCQTIVHPLSFAAGLYDSRAPEISEVTRNLRLAGPQNRYKETDAHF